MGERLNVCSSQADHANARDHTNIRPSMAGGLEDFIISEGALHPLHPLDRSPIQIRPGRITNPVGVYVLC